MYSIKLQNIKKKLAFTLVELVIVIAIISLLAAVIVVAINPNSIFINGRNSTRSSDLNTLLNAFNRYIAESPLTSTRTLSDFNGYTNLLSDAIVSNAGANYTNGKCNNAVTTGIAQAVSGSYDINTTGTNYIDLSLLISNNYLPKVPQDPQGNPYQACIDTVNNNQLVLFAPSTETLSNKISSFFPTMFEGAGTNYIYNPSAEIDTSNWGCYDNAGNCTLSRITSDAKVGTASFRVQTGVSGTVTIIYNGSLSSIAQLGLTTSSSFCYAGYMKVISGSAYLSGYTLTAGRSITGAYGSSSTTLNSWNRVSSCFIIPATTDIVDIKVTIAQNSDVYIDGIQFEANKTNPSSYIDGSLLPSTQYGWTVPGSPHASTSYRVK